MIYNVSNCEVAVVGTYCGTPHYFAPEMVMLKLGRRTTYDNKVDCWALGVIL